MHTIACFYLLLCITSIRSQPHNFVFQHLTTRDGLASNYIYSIFQDSKGIYWIGTISGLQKFDGYTLSKPLISGSDLLTSPKITETRDGTVWISTGTSLLRYNPFNEHFTSTALEGDHSKMNLTVFEDSRGNVWLINPTKIYKYDQVKEKLIDWIKFPSIDPSMTGGAITFNKKTNTIWVQNGTTLYRILPLEKSIKEVKMPPMIANLWADSDSHLWLSFWNQFVYRYNIKTGKIDSLTMPYKNKGSQTVSFGIATCFKRDRSGKLWIGTIDAGLWYFDEPSIKLVQLKTDKLQPESFHYLENVYTIMTDKEGSIWVGTDKGLNIFNPFYQRFYTISNADLPTKGIPSFVSQKPFQTSTGDILISTTHGGWLQYDRHFNLKRNFSVMLTATSSYIDTCKTIVTCFAEDKNGKIWVGHRGGLLGICDLRSGSIEYKLVPEFKKCKISDIQCDSLGNMWFAIRLANNSLVKWDIGLKSFKVYNDPLLNKGGNEESSIMITSCGAIWVQTFGNGMYRFDPEKEKIIEIYRGTELPFKIPSALHALTALNDSIIAIASYADGFFLLNTIQKTIRSLNTDMGLPSNIARAITIDRRGNYWLAMLSDFVRMDPRTKQVVSIDEEEGILNKNFSFGFTKLQDGTLMIASATGLLYFHPDSIATQQVPPDVLITNLKVSSKPVPLDSILAREGNKIHLSYNQNSLIIDYVSISFLNRRTTQYFYQLEGLDKNWIEAGTLRTINYTNLNPGKYVFKVKCRNRDGIFSKHITSLVIIVSPPFWLTWWAYTLYGILTCALVYFIYRNRIYSLEQKQQANVKAMVVTQEQERKRISRDLHDDVGTKLSALKLFLSVLREKAVASKSTEISKLAASAEQFISEAIQDVRRLLLNLSPAVLEEFGYTTAVEVLVNKINETKQIQFTLVVFGMTERLPKDYELALYRITQELINNVLKHAEAKNVSLQIGQRDKKIILMMEDDGKGFDINAHKEGYGLQNLDTRTRLMHGTIAIDSQPGKGTSVFIEIPYG